MEGSKLAVPNEQQGFIHDRSSVTPLAKRAKAAVRPWADRLTGGIGSVVSVSTTRPEVVLTFDDGPDAEGTEQVLSALHDHAATATFFVLMTRARRYPSLLAEVVAQGHEIALHGPDHRPLVQFTRAAVRERTSAAKKELEDQIGTNVGWFRPPYGRQAPITWLAVRQSGLMPVMWGPTTWDWRDIGQHERVEKALSTVNRGNILLAHDGFAGPDDYAAENPTHTLDRHDLISRILTRYSDLGLSGRSLGAAAQGSTVVRAARFRR